ncbi:armadillo-type protein [Cladochytrium replicatum]|nr:armadillo-type protein [Cladochytrium replicatum]
MPGTEKNDDEVYNRNEAADVDGDDDQRIDFTGISQMTPLTACPSYRPDHIHNIVETVERYNHDHIPVLETYVLEQMQSNSYDRDACLAVLKLYQFNPASVNYPIIGNVLLLCLAALPDPDFNLSLCLLSEEIIEDPAIARLVTLQQSLERCRFSEFWTQLESEDTQEYLAEMLEDYPHFREAVRNFVALTVQASYQIISMARLAEYVNLAGETLSDWVDDRGWELDSDNPNLVVLPLTKDNQVKPVVVQESVKFDQLTKLIGHARLTM